MGIILEKTCFKEKDDVSYKQVKYVIDDEGDSKTPSTELNLTTLQPILWFDLQTERLFSIEKFMKYYPDLEDETVLTRY